MKFRLTLEFKSTKPVSAEKVFNTTNGKRGWGMARRWQHNCVQICGRNELNEICSSTLLERIPEVT
jgi:hypothetical protein